MSIWIYLWRVIVGLWPVWPGGLYLHNPHAQLPVSLPWMTGRSAVTWQSPSGRVLTRNSSVALICRNSFSMSAVSFPSKHMLFFGLIKCASPIAYVRFIITNNLLEKKLLWQEVKKLFFGTKSTFLMLALDHNNLHLGVD